MIMFWVAVLAISVLLYVLLDGFDLGVGILFGMTRDQEQRGTMLSAVSPVWDGNETWLVVTGVMLSDRCCQKPSRVRQNDSAADYCIMQVGWPS